MILKVRRRHPALRAGPTPAMSAIAIYILVVQKTRKERTPETTFRQVS